MIYYRDLRNSRIISVKPGGGIQLFKVMDPIESNDYNNHIKKLKSFYRKVNAKNSQIRTKLVKFFSL